MVDFWMGGVDQRLFGPSTAAPPEKIQKSNPHTHLGSVQQPHAGNKVTGIANTVKHQHKTMKVELIPQQLVY